MLWLGILLLLPIILATGGEATCKINFFKSENKSVSIKSIEVIGESTEELDLSGSGIFNFTENAFENCSHVKTLHLYNNLLNKLQDNTFASLTTLTELDLSNNLISEMRTPFVNLKNLLVLNLSYNLIDSLNATDFFGLTASTIFLEGNNISDMSTELFENKSNPIIPINEQRPKPKVSPPFKKRVRPCINDKKLISVEHYTEGEKFAISCSPDRYYENGFLRLNSLSIERFEKGWFKLQNSSIHHIDLNRNRITRLTSEMFNDLPENISSVDLSNNFIVRLEKSVVINEHLRGFNFEFNKIIEIEDYVFINTRLTALNFGNNKLKDTEFAATLHPTLTEIHLHSNEIAEISPESFSKLKNLKNLTLSSNQITVIYKDSLSGLTGLEWLQLSNNTIQTIEVDSFEYLTNLTDLHLQYNKIDTLDSGLFAYLKNIRNINIGYNKLLAIERGTFRNSVNLCQLILSGNPIKVLEYGALRGLRKNKECRVHLRDVPIVTIDRAVFASSVGSSDVLSFENNRSSFEETEKYSEWAASELERRLAPRQGYIHGRNLIQKLIINNPRRVRRVWKYKEHHGNSTDRQIEITHGGINDSSVDSSSARFSKSNTFELLCLRIILTILTFILHI